MKNLESHATMQANRRKKKKGITWQNGISWESDRDNPKFKRVGGESKLQTSTKTYQVPNPTNVGFLYTQPHIHTQQ